MMQNEEVPRAGHLDPAIELLEFAEKLVCVALPGLDLLSLRMVAQTGTSDMDRCPCGIV